MNAVVMMISSIIGYLLVFLIMATIALICAKPGRKWVWALYWIGVVLTAFSMIGLIKGGNTSFVLIVLIPFVVLLILFALGISKKLAASSVAPSVPGPQPDAKDNVNAPIKTEADVPVKNTVATSVQNVIQQQQDRYASLAKEKEATESLSESDLMQIFAEYFAPNTSFFAPGSNKATAYYGVINAAKVEILNNEKLLSAATKWNMEQYKALVSNPPPVIGNMNICGLIFKMGQFAVVKDMVYCVDFVEQIPNCIALYLLLIAQKQPENQRTQILDAGAGTNRSAFIKAIDTLRVCDPNWDCKIW